MTMKQASTFILQPPFLNKNTSDSLLHKRYESSQLGDLLSKKVKTGSTTISESTSCQDSPTLRKVKSNFSEDSCMNEREELSTSPSTSDFSSRSIQRPLDEEFCQLQLALQILQRKLNLYQEIPPLRETISDFLFNPEELYIPPLASSPSEPMKVSQKENTKQNKKKSKKEDENELQVSYGDVEFPFLSLSTPMPQEAALDFSQLLNIPTLFMQKSEPEVVKNSVFSIEKRSKSEKVQATEVSQKSLVMSKAEPKKFEAESEKVVKEQLGGKKTVKVIGNLKEDSKEKAMVVEKIQKKNKEVQQKEQDRDSEKAKKIKQDCDELYARPAYLSRRRTERRKNKWQIEQEEKFKGIQFQPPFMKENSDIFFGGIKKKSAITPVGPEYQVDVSMVMIQRKLAPLRKPQMKWNPGCHDQSKLTKFFGSVKKLFNMNVSEEGVVDVIVKNNNDLEKALEYLRANKAECRKMLSIKPVKEMCEE